MCQLWRLWWVDSSSSTAGGFSVSALPGASTVACSVTVAVPRMRSRLISRVHSRRAGVGGSDDGHSIER